MINNKTANGLYMTAQEAAATLSVSPATIYAYVSRGLIRSEAAADGRNKRYRADDVRALKDRRAPLETRAAVESASPLALDSAICLITPEGPFYRGASAAELAEKSSFEHVAALLWNVADQNPFADSDPGPLWRALEAIAAATAGRPFIDRAAAAMTLAGGFDPAAFNGTVAGGAAIGARALRILTTLATGDAPPGPQPIHRALAAAWAPARADAPDLIRRALVLLADHELNASTFAARVAVSTGASIYDALAAALATLKGPRHGGASPRAMRFLAALPADAAEGIKQRRAEGERLPGFGHTIYRATDPRAAALLTALDAAGADRRLTRDIVTAAREIAGVDPNIDYALAVLALHLGLPADSGLTLFAIGRTAGWTAHAIEQRASETLIRPRARYTGIAPRASTNAP